MKLKIFIAAAATLASSAAFAEVTGNIGAVSEYMYRGITQGAGGEAAVQGGLDYAHDSGLYLGTWASNVGFAGGSEVDLYGGFDFTLGPIAFDVGAIYYMYPEYEDFQEEATSIDTAEFKIAAGAGPVTFSYAYSDDWFGTGLEASYVNGALSLPLSETLNVDGAVGYSFGDAFDGIEYVDYMLGLSKSVTDAFTVSMKLIGSDYSVDTGSGSELEDKGPKFVVGGIYGFTL